MHFYSDQGTIIKKYLSVVLPQNNYGFNI